MICYMMNRVLVYEEFADWVFPVLLNAGNRSDYRFRDITATIGSRAQQSGSKRVRIILSRIR